MKYVLMAVLCLPACGAMVPASQALTRRDFVEPPEALVIAVEPRLPVPVEVILLVNGHEVVGACGNAVHGEEDRHPLQCIYRLPADAHRVRFILLGPGGTNLCQHDVQRVRIRHGGTAGRSFRCGA